MKLQELIRERAGDVVADTRSIDRRLDHKIEEIISLAGEDIRNELRELDNLFTEKAGIEIEESYRVGLKDGAKLGA